MLQLPLRFERNAGQWDGRVHFLAKSRGVALALTDQGPELHLDPYDAQVVRVLRMVVAGANARPTIEAGAQLETKTNYFIGDDPTQWRTNVANYDRVTYRDMLPGIDLVYHGDSHNLEYDFVVAPGASPAAIAVSFEGASSVSRSEGGELEVYLADAKLVQRKPVAYQEIDGERRFVDASFHVLGHNSAGFEVGDYDRSRPLVIDPVLLFSSFLGGASTDMPTDIALTASDQIVIGGYTSSTGFATEGAYSETHNGANDGFIAMFNAAGTALSFVTYIGGGGQDVVWKVAVDGTGAIVGAGTAGSGMPAFPTTLGAYDTSVAGWSDGFVFKLQPDGSTLTFSTVLGGSGDEALYGIALDSSNSIYATGFSASSDYPVTLTKYEGDDVGKDAVVSKLSADGSSLMYSTYLGGNGEDEGLAVAVKSNGNFVVSGKTTSTDFPVGMSPAQGTLAGVNDLFVSEFAANGASLVASTYLGGSSADYSTSNNRICFAMALDSNDLIYLGGTTQSTNFPTTPGSLHALPPSENLEAYFTKLSADGSTILYSTYVAGSTSADGVFGIDVDSQGRAALAMFAGGAGLLTVDAIQESNGGNIDSGVTVFDASGAVVFSTYLGGVGADHAIGVKWTSSGQLALGSVCTAGFPVTAGAADVTHSGGNDACVSLISLFRIAPASKSLVVGENVTFQAPGASGTVSWSLTQNESGASQTNGVYTAGSTPGTDVLRAEDTGTGRTFDATITVYPALMISPTSSNVLAAGMVSFSASGGIGTKTFSLATNGSGGSIDANTGEYVAGSTLPATDVVRVTDADGRTTNATVHVGTPLGIAPTTRTLAPRESATFTASGGVAPYTYSLATSPSGATIDASTGAYTAGATGNTTDTVVVTDAASVTALSTVTVTAGVTLSPASASVAPGQAQHFSVSGGSGTGFTFSFTSNESGATLDSNGDYMAGETANVTDVIKVTDSLGNSASASIGVGGGVTLTPASLQVAPGGTQTFEASGGSGTGYHFELLQADSGGSIDASSGVYVAGSVGEVSDVVQVTDSLGNSAQVEIEVTAALTLSETQLVVAPRGTLMVAAVGGAPPYQYTLSSDLSGATLDAETGEYTAGAVGDVSDEVLVKDQHGATASATIDVGPAIQISGIRDTIYIGARVQLTASGGSGEGYVWRLLTDDAGNLDSETGMYTTDRAQPNRTVVVEVEDSLGNTARASFRLQLDEKPFIDDDGCNVSGPWTRGLGPESLILLALIFRRRRRR